jgi:putative tryptophan/tyrosine transport system substrate-binding protein
MSKRFFGLTLSTLPFALSLVGAMLLVLSVPAEAEQARKIHRIGLLYPGTPSSGSARIEAFRRGLREVGYSEGQNIAIEYRYAGGKIDRLPELAAELVRLNVEIIVTMSTPAVRAAKNATSAIPIIMLATADPARAEFITSLARPGGNITGMTNIAVELTGKQLELLRETIPKLSRVAVLAQPAESGSSLFVEEAQDAGKGLGVKILPLLVNDSDEFKDAFSVMAKERAGALVVQPRLIGLGHGRQIADLAASNRLPTVSGSAQFVGAGGLMSYGPDVLDLARRAAYYADKILKGARPADLPVQQPMKFELVINLKTAKQIGLTIPPNVLARADRVIR